MGERPVPQTGSVVIPTRESEQAQLERAYQTAQSTYGSLFQILTIVAAADGALITFGIPNQNPVMIILGGVLVALSVLQLRHMGRCLSATFVTAITLERRLGLVGRLSVMSAFLGATFDRDVVDKVVTLIREAKDRDDSTWIDDAIVRIPFFRGTATTVSAVFAGLQVAVGMALAMTPKLWTVLSHS